KAEDGIRDRNVTGVQTCALPISQRLEGGVPDGQEVRVAHVADHRRSDDDVAQRLISADAARRAPGGGVRDLPPAVSAEDRARGRSEERRVGKEGRTWRRAAAEK